jgi:hypothetical protein
LFEAELDEAQLTKIEESLRDFDILSLKDFYSKDTAGTIKIFEEGKLKIQCCKSMQVMN